MQLQRNGSRVRRHVTAGKPRQSRNNSALSLAHLRRTCGGRTPFYLSGAIAFLAIPQLALADTVQFRAASEFEQRLSAIIGRSGHHTLSYTGEAASLASGSAITAPGAGQSLLIDLGNGSLHVTDSKLTIGRGTTLNLGTGTEAAHIRLGSAGKTGELHIDGGVVNRNGPGNNSVRIGYNTGETGILRITNGGQLNLATGEDATGYTGFFPGYNGGTAQIILDNGHINFGQYGASMRFGIGAESHVVMTNGSSIDSSLAASQFWVGEGTNGNSTVLVDNSRIDIRGTGTGTTTDDRYFFIGKSGGTGVMTQRGDQSVVHVSGIALVGIGEGTGSYGEYNLEGGLFEVGREGVKTNFRVGVGFGSSANTSEAVLNVSGGTARFWGNMEVAAQGGSNQFATGTVTVSGGEMSIAENLNFGRGQGTFTLTGGEVSVGKKITFAGTTGALKLNGGALVLGGDNAITGTGLLSFNGGALVAAADLGISHAATVLERGAIFRTGTHTITYSGALSGIGGLTKEGAGALILTGNNAGLKGGVLITGGEVDPRHASALGSGAVTLDGGALVLSHLTELTNDIVTGAEGGTVNLGDSRTGRVEGERVISSDISGSGDITFTDGMLLYDGQMSLSGRTVIGAGADVLVTDGGQLSGQSIVEIAEDGLLTLEGEQQAGGLTGDGTLSLAGSLGLTHDSDLTFAGTLVSPGGFAPFIVLPPEEEGDDAPSDARLEKYGAGMFTLSGDSGEYTGSIDVYGGELRITGALAQATAALGAGTRLSGTGSIGWLEALGDDGWGYVAPGESIGTFSVVNDAAMAGLIYEAELDTAGPVGDDGYHLSDRILVGGTADLDGAGLHLVMTGPYAPERAWLILEAGEIAGEFDQVTHDYAFLTPDITYTAAEEGEPGTVVVRLGRNDLTISQAGLTPNQRAAGAGADTLDETNPLSAALLALALPEVPAALDAISGEIHASGRTALSDAGRQLSFAALGRMRSPAPTGGTRVWAQGFSGSADIDSDGNADALDLSSRGLMAGADAQVGDWLIGAMIGTGSSSFKSAGRASSGDAETLQLGLYAAGQWDAVSLRTGLSYGWSDISTRRRAAFSGFSEDLTASYDARQLQLFGELAYRMETETSSFEPFLNFTHQQLSTSAFTETGGSAALRAADQTSSTSFVTLGVHAASRFDLSGTSVRARGTLGWQSAFGDTDPTSTHRFAGGQDFTVHGAAIADSAALIEAGVDVELSPNAMLSLSYGGTFGADSRAQNGRLGLQIRF